MQGPKVKIKGEKVNVVKSVRKCEEGESEKDSGGEFSVVSGMQEEDVGGRRSKEEKQSEHKVEVGDCPGSKEKI